MQWRRRDDSGPAITARSLVLVKRVSPTMPLVVELGVGVSLGAIAQGVAEELIAAVVAAVGQGGLRQARGTDWEAEVRAACQSGMEVAVRQAATGLPPEAMSQAADSLAYDLERAGASGWLADALAQGVLDGAVDDSIRDDLRAALGPKRNYLAAQGINATRIVDVFPEAVVDDLARRARPGEPLFPVLQIMRLREEVRGLAWRIEVLRDAVENLHPSSPVPTQTTLVDPTIRPSGQAEINALDGRIVEATALVLARQDPPSLADARQRLAGLLADLGGRVHWRSVDVTPRSIAVEGLVDQLLAKDAGAAELLPARAFLRGRQGRLYDALADYQTFFPVAGIARAKIQRQAGGLLMTLGHYTQARQLLQRSRETGLTVQDALGARQHELWIDDYQGRHLHAARESRRVMYAAREQGETASIYGAGHREARALFAAAMNGGRDRTLLELALRELERTSRYNTTDNPYWALWMYRIRHELDADSDDRWWHQAQEQMEDAGGLADAHIWLDRGTRALEDGRPRLAVEHLLVATDLWRRSPYPKGLFDASIRLGIAYARFARTAVDRSRAVIHFRMAEQLAERLGLPQLAEARRGLVTAAARLPIARGELLASVDEQVASLLPARLLSGEPFDFG